MEKIIQMINDGYEINLKREHGVILLVKVTDFNGNHFTSALPLDDKHITEKKILEVLKFNADKITELNYGK
jgi:hypothetical protein